MSRMRLPRNANPYIERSAVANPMGWGIPAVQKTVKHVMSGVDKMFNTPRIYDSFPSLEEASVRIILCSSGGIIIDHGPDKNAENVEVPGGRFIARTCENLHKERQGTLKSVVVPYSVNRDWIKPLETFLELGMAEKTYELREYLEAPQFRTFGFTLNFGVRKESPYSLIPGTYKHYTSQDGFDGITEDDFIYGSEKEVRGSPGHYVYLSMLSLSPEEACRTYWTDGERQTVNGRSDYVISFNLKDGLPVVVDYNKKDPFIECWINGNLDLNDVDIAYAGANDPSCFSLASI